jgi:hypothetical protein
MDNGILRNGLVWAIMGNEALTALYDLRWMIAAVIMLLFADAYTGTRESFMLFDAAKERGDREGMARHRFHLSRFTRRTVCKLIEYLTYMLLGCIFGFAIFEPCGICNHIISACIGLSVGAACEISSILGHMLKLHHITLPRFTWGTAGLFFGKVIAIFLKHKNADLGEAVEETVEQTFKKEQK